MPKPSISIPSSIPALALIMGPCGGLVGPVVAHQTIEPDRGSDALSQAQLDCIEAKLDALLQRLGTGPDAGDAVSSEETGLANASPTSSLGGAPAAGVEAIAVATGSFDGSAAAVEPPPLPADTDSYRSGALAVAHAAPTRSQPLSEIPADNIGSPIRLTDLSDRGVRYAGPAGIELQSWVRATETRRYQIAADLQPRFGKGAISALPCTVSAWLEDQSISSEIRSIDPWGAKGGPVALSAVLGAKLQPGFYKLRFWIACADLSPARSGESSQVELLLKTTSEMNLRPVTAEDMVHRQG